MNKLFTDIEIIDRYLKGASIGNERDVVKLRLMTDKDFRQLFDDIEIMIEGINRTAVLTSKEEKLNHLRNFYHEAYGIVNEDELLTEEEDEDFSENTTYRSSFESDEEPTPGSGLGKSKVISFPAAAILGQYKVAVAAAVTLLIAAWFVVFQMNPVSNQQLFAEYFEPFPNMGLNNTRGSQALDAEGKAYAAYDREDFEDAAILFEDLLLAKKENEIMTRFYLGNTYLQLEEIEKSIKEFSIVAEEGKGLAVKAKWYLGLSYLKLDNVEKAKELFREVTKVSGDDNAKKAAEILDRLE